jgi:hypothetical protein
MSKFSLKKKRSKLGQPPNKVKPDTYSEPDKTRLLQGYTLVPQHNWTSNHLTPNSHIRYQQKDGAFRQGGFIMDSFIGKNGLVIKLTAKSSKSAREPFTWHISTGNVGSIWKKNYNDSNQPQQYQQTQYQHQQPQTHQPQQQQQTNVSCNNPVAQIDMFADLSALELRIDQLESTNRRTNEKLEQIIQFIFRKMGPQKSLVLQPMAP